jgi:hypothetical protein
MIELSSGSLESKRDMKETEGRLRLATRTIIILPVGCSFLIETVLYLVLATDKHGPAAIRQRSTESMCHDGEASEVTACESRYLTCPGRV